MNVLYLQDHSGIGGAQLSLLDFLDGLRASVPQVTPHVVVGSDGFLSRQLSLRRIRLTVMRFPEYRKARDFWRRPAFLRDLAGLCRRQRIDVVHANTSQVAPWSARLARKLGIASCVTLREVSDAARIQKYQVLDNDALIAVSCAVQAASPASPKVVQLYDGIACPEFLPVTAETLAELEIPAAHGLKVGFLGSLSVRKGPHVLLGAAPVVLAKSPGTLFVFIGDGEAEFRHQLRAQAGRLGVAASVIFAGRIENAARYLKTFDLLVMPSFTEGLGRGAVEAMYAGLPVVASRVGGLGEIVDDGRTGRLVAPNDPSALAEAILFYLESETRRREHGERGRQRAHDQFGPTPYATRVVGLYAELLNQ